MTKSAAHLLITLCASWLFFTPPSRFGGISDTLCASAMVCEYEKKQEDKDADESQRSLFCVKSKQPICRCIDKEKEGSVWS